MAKKKTVSYNAIDIDGYTVYRTDRPKRGGGVAIYVKDSFEVTVLLSESVVKKYELLALNLIVSKTFYLPIVGCYRPPLASTDAISSLMHWVTSLNYKELVLLGDFNVNWLQSVSDCFKAICDSLNLFQLGETPTRPNLKDYKKSTLIDLILAICLISTLWPLYMLMMLVITAS